MLKKKNRTIFDVALGLSPYFGTSVDLELKKNNDSGSRITRIKFV